MTDFSLNKPAADLTTCDREPIHIPGFIQPHGVLFACGTANWRITHASANVAMYFGRDADELIGKQLDVLIGSAAVRELSDAGAHGDTAALPIRRFGLEIGEARFRADVTLHVHAGRRIVEIEPRSTGDQSASLDLVRAMISRIRKADSVEDLWRRATRQLRMLIGYDRVMIYRFAHDGAGEVVAEEKRPDLESFKNLNYPASDIPKQARELYKKNVIRLIGDVGAVTTPVLPAVDGSGQLLDMSFALLRAVSPVHIEYLKNMGVGASMSLSIIVGGELWGLMACHNDTAKVVPANVRVAAELFGQFFSVQLEALERETAFTVMQTARRRLDSLVAAFPSVGSLAETLAEKLVELRQILPCDGVGISIDGVWHGLGLTPPVTAIPTLCRFLDSLGERGVFATQELGARLEPADAYKADVSGVLAIPLAASGGNSLIYFRREKQHTVAWAGDPNKPVVVGALGDRLTPRMSFAAWKQDVAGQSLPWSKADLATGEALRMSLLEVVLQLREVLAEERRRNDERQTLLIAELNHRVKNILALISALVKRGQAPDDTLASYVVGLEGRIKALAASHDLIAKSSVADLRGLIENELAPYVTNPGQIALHGPAVTLEAYAFPIVALMLHEMTTNAVKYGALSVPHGRLSLEWQFEPSGKLIFNWLESGGPAVQVPSREGFGTVLIKRNIPYELGGEATVRYELSGVRARFVIPAKYLGLAKGSAAAEKPIPAKSMAAVGSITGLKVLLVEDQMLIAFDAQAMLEDAGASQVETFADAASALHFLQTTRPDMAVLDVNLASGTSYPTAEQLLELGLPFIFATGYGEDAVISPRFRDVHVVRKPYTAASLLDGVMKALSPGK